MKKAAYNISVSLLIALLLSKNLNKVICMREFEIILFQTQSLSIKVKFSFIKNILKPFCELAFVYG
jgi:hypothetical protein